MSRGYYAPMKTDNQFASKSEKYTFMKTSIVTLGIAVSVLQPHAGVAADPGAQGQSKI
jgi:hypothetical protein